MFLLKKLINFYLEKKNFFILYRFDMQSAINY